MSYTIPRQWSHGDAPTAADMQKYSDGLTFLNAIIRPLNFATPFSTMEEAQQTWLVHAKRYLIYASTGRIIDPAGIGADVDLSSDNDINTYDLDEIDWLTSGKLYQVNGCSCALEDEQEA
jgi:hypothetical protein